MKLSHIIFDLDGTLVDSSPGILESFHFAFEQLEQVPLQPLTREIIGPPLVDTLALLAGSDQPALIQPLADAFKQHYDGDGYTHTEVFPGITEMLVDLAGFGHRLYIATNKRIHPTRRILSHLGWNTFFDGVYSLDFFDPPCKHKAEVIANILSIHNLNKDAVIYIGDRKEDMVAAQANRLQFGFASWGFGASLDELSQLDCRLFGQPADLGYYCCNVSQ